MSDNEDTYTDNENTDEEYTDDENNLDEIMKKKKKNVSFVDKKTYKELKSCFLFSLQTIFMFWVVFPFYSYQLQIFEDQKFCSKDSKDYDKCNLKYVSYKTPYGDGTPPLKLPGERKGFLSYILSKLQPPKLPEFPFNPVDIFAGQSANVAAKTAKIEQLRQTGQRGGSKFNLEEAVYKILYSILNESLGADKTSLDYVEKCENLDFLKDSDVIKEKTKASDETKLTDTYNVNKRPEKKETIDEKDSRIKWPYKYIKEFEDLQYNTTKCPRKYGWRCSLKNPLMWYKAWFAQIQKTSWSTTNWIISFILSKIQPFISPDVNEWLIKCKCASFIDLLTSKIDKFIVINEKENKKLVKIQNDKYMKEDIKNLKVNKINEYIKNNGDLIASLTRTRDDFQNNIFNIFKNISNTNDKQDVSISDFIVNIMKPKIISEGQRMKKTNYKENNIYTDFLISVLKPEDPKITTNGFKPPSVFRPLNSIGRNHWKRYILTWFMWAVTLGIMAISGFTGFWMTVIGAFNKYSFIILPLLSFSLLFGLSMYNSIAQPLSLLFYSIFGIRNIRSYDILCPNSSGRYQMKKNKSRYFGINMFLTLFFIITNIGLTMYRLADGNSALETAGLVTISIFPIASIIIIILKIYNLLKLLSRNVSSSIKKLRKKKI